MGVGHPAIRLMVCVQTSAKTFPVDLANQDLFVAPLHRNYSVTRSCRPLRVRANAPVERRVTVGRMPLYFF